MKEFVWWYFIKTQLRISEDPQNSPIKACEKFIDQRILNRYNYEKVGRERLKNDPHLQKRYFLDYR